MERTFIGLNVAVLSIGDALILADEPPAQLVLDRFLGAGHKIVAQAVVGDFLQAIRAKFLEWIADPAIDVIIATAGTQTAHGGEALKPLITRPLVGFSDLFRYMTFEEIGTAAMLVDAEAAQCKSTFVFLLPSSIGAVRTALDRLIIPQLDYRTKPANLVMRLPRVSHLDTNEKTAAAEPWIKPAIVGVPAPPKPPARRTGTIPPPLPSVSVVRKIEVVPKFVPKVDTKTGAVPAPTPPTSRPKISTNSQPLPLKAPALPAPMVEELEARTPTAREFESAEMTGPIPRTPAPKVMVDAELSQPTVAIVPRSRTTTDTSRAIDEGIDPFRTYAASRGNRRFIVAWLGIAVAAAALLVVFLMMRRSDKDAQAAVAPPVDRVAAVTPTIPEPQAEPPRVEPPLPVPVPVAVEPMPPAPVPNETKEIDMPIDPEGAKPKAAKVARTPRPPKDPVEPTEPKEAGLEAVSTDNGCDEVSCALDRYKLACCAPFKPAPPPEKPEPTSDLPEKIDRAMIVEGVGRVKGAVVRCGEVHGSARGTVKVQVQVSAEGRVGSVGVASTPDPALGACVASAIAKATFDKTQNGGSFGYPFVF